MVDERVRAVTDSTFDQEVLNASGAVLVDFWAPWCGPCKMVSPLLEELAGAYEGKVTFTQMNVDENQQTPARYGIRAIPTLLLFKGGEVVDKLVGAAPRTQLEALLNKSEGE